GAVTDIFPGAREARDIEVLFVEDEVAHQAGVRVDSGADHQAAGECFGGVDVEIDTAIVTRNNLVGYIAWRRGQDARADVRLRHGGACWNGAAGDISWAERVCCTGGDSRGWIELRRRAVLWGRRRLGVCGRLAVCGLAVGRLAVWWLAGSSVVARWWRGSIRI